MKGLLLFERLLLVQFLALALFLISSCFGLSALVPLSFTLWCAMAGFIYKSGIHFPKTMTDSIPILIFVAFGLLAYVWLDPLFVAPSQDDTINHLSFLEAILSSGNALLGKINRPGEELFGASPYHFYPTGFHAWLALLIRPILFVCDFINCTWASLVKASLIITLGLWPAVTYTSIKKYFPALKPESILFIVTIIFTQAIFPIGALGEGGLSRIFAFALFTPLWMRCISCSIRGLELLVLFSVFFPCLLFIHPSLLPFILVIPFCIKRESLIKAALSSAVGALFFLFLFKSAKQEITHPQLLEQLLGQIRTNSPSAFSHLKSPFHYWFSDSLGFGKFLSPKNLLIYLGILFSFTGRIPRWCLFLILAPFLIASFALFDFSMTNHLGLIYYHSTKRISEITPLISLTLLVFTVPIVQDRMFKMKSSATLIYALSSVFFLVFAYRSNAFLGQYHELFHSVTKRQALEVKEKLNPLSNIDVIINDNKSLNFIRFLTRARVYNLEPECAEVGAHSDYCVNRISISTKLSINPLPIWWIPKPGINVDDTLIKNRISVSNDANLLQLGPKTE